MLSIRVLQIAITITITQYDNTKERYKTNALYKQEPVVCRLSVLLSNKNNDDPASAARAKQQPSKNNYDCS